jgi:hypothetical protein
MHLFKKFRAAGGSKAQQDKLIRDFQSINKKVVEVTKSTGAIPRPRRSACTSPRRTAPRLTLRLRRCLLQRS